ncbi:MAG: Sec-independent protein translocase protein TatB [Gammaproteobacteria bacterium]|jgi:sec-independent protein translocase protein TatB
MFDIGGWEIIIIAVVALIVIGPERLPDVARTVGRWVGRARRFIVNVKADIDREIQQEELKKALENDAGLDEIKQIMNTERFSLEEEDEQPDYQVKAINDDDKREDDLEEELEDEITSNETGHYDAADLDYDTIEQDSTVTKENDR